LARLLVCVGWVFGFAIIPSTAYSAGDVQDITGAVIPILSQADPFGSSGELYADGRLSSRFEFRFRVRVRNQSGDPIEGDSLIVVVQRVESADYLHDATNELDYVGAGGRTRDGKPFYRVPLGGKSELGPYAESEEFMVEIRNPNLSIIYPPVLRVYGVRRSDPERFEDTFRTLVEKGKLNVEEKQGPRPPSSPGVP
ncbi:MAG: hypothetical protein ACREIE_05435, partial [Nitrospiraceae bacterium]